MSSPLPVTQRYGILGSYKDVCTHFLTVAYDAVNESDMKHNLKARYESREPVIVTGVDTDEILAWSRERLANYKVPRGVVCLAELPTNATGKVVKEALRERAASDLGVA